ncbi:MAG: hydroxyisourate hydrolase [Opitutaceae bacterium]|nr:hydroxyisourate hydrolase [Opitutaceae bacterium]|tara:strand:- start:2462 stop:2809 length:348 start_codon:yes stop_codon:yes gene_type:complete
MSAKLSTHVLDTKNGIPAAGVKIELFEITDEGNLLHTTATTNCDGRTDSPLLSVDTMKEGDFLLKFHIGDYFYDSAEEAPFLSIIPIQFRVNDASAGYHVPLLASPWSYSTYKGN